MPPRHVWKFETPDDGFAIVFYWYVTQKLSGTAQKKAQKKKNPLKRKKGSIRCLNIAKNRETEMK